jgi:hypothetical protein
MPENDTPGRRERALARLRRGLIRLETLLQAIAVLADRGSRTDAGCQECGTRLALTDLARDELRRLCRLVRRVQP